MRQVCENWGHGIRRCKRRVDAVYFVRGQFDSIQYEDLTGPFKVCDCGWIDFFWQQKGRYCTFADSRGHATSGDMVFSDTYMQAASRGHIGTAIWPDKMECWQWQVTRSNEWGDFVPGKLAANGRERGRDIVMMTRFGDAPWQATSWCRIRLMGETGAQRCGSLEGRAVCSGLSIFRARKMTPCIGGWRSA